MGELYANGLALFSLAAVLGGFRVAHKIEMLLWM